MASLTRSIKTISNDLYKERNLKKLVSKFKQYSDITRFRTKTGIYESTVHRLASAKRFKWIEEILEHQKQYRPDITKENFNVRLVSLYGKCGLFENAQKVFDEMPDRSLKSVNAILSACVNSKKYDKLESLFQELPEKLKVKPDVVTYNIMIKGLCEKGEFDKVVVLVDEIEKNGLKHDLVTFNTILGAFYANGKFDDGEKMWNLMVKKNVKPDIRSYNAKLVGLVNENKVSEAVKLVGELGSFELKPDVFTYGALIRGYCKKGNLEEAKKWYGELVNSGSAPDKAIFGSVISSACEKGDFDWAFELCKEVFKRKCNVDMKLLQGVVDGLVKSSRVREAKEVVHLGKSNDYHLYKLNLPSDE
ncbi:small ribosomal subunit protein mS79 (rPPR3b)-like [Lycium ferocissimum]|uniref:small ribosomal subunit protein mS79 (rPPR3b)-like n=1 Tax=Lycium ferocissimum TaxID=112874 RepID=UPI00281659E9|nr:small ribosomal subunit protein mS79 (rPPR3b)-like [Lycium ferocissimum]XP_059282188.1 small ribosomal subunit protein mS79 (rPPR3b)-like [Lycium ferocissimum]